MNSVLVTGGEGQLGKSLQEIHSDYPDLQFYFTDKDELDITRPEELENFFSEIRPAICINAAAYTNVEGAERNQELAIEVNAKGVKNLAQACKKYHVLLIHISTDYVFDGKKKEGYLPNDKPNPVNIYGASKLQGETYVEHILDEFMILRTSWLYSDYGKNFYTTIRRKLQEVGHIGVTDLQRGCPTHARNLARFILNWLKDPNRTYGIVHYSGGEAMTWYDFARKIAEEHAPDQAERIVRDNSQRGKAARPSNSVLR